MLSSIVRDRRVGCNFWIINIFTTGVAHIRCGRRRGSCSDHSSCWSAFPAIADENTTSNAYGNNDWQTYAHQTNHSYNNACDCIKERQQKLYEHNFN